ncbi:MAG: hypothetical protein K6B74_02280 [Ruminococcus sp.]|nr:hypothetical protein [Ruminococcus sp.]
MKINIKTFLSSAAAAMILCGALSGCSFGGKTIEKNDAPSAQQPDMSVSSLAAPDEVDLSAATPIDSSSAEKTDVGDKHEIETKLPDQIVEDPGVPVKSTTETTRAPSLDNAADTITTTTSAAAIAPPSPDSDKNTETTESVNTSRSFTYDRSTSNSDKPKTTTTAKTTTASSKKQEKPAADSTDSGNYVYDEPTSGDEDSSSKEETIIDIGDDDSSGSDSGSGNQVIELPIIPIR